MASDSFDCKLEISDLLLVIGAMRLAPHNAQRRRPPRVSLLQQHVQLVEHRPHAARGLGDKVLMNWQILDEQLGVAQPIAPRLGAVASNSSITAPEVL